MTLYLDNFTDMNNKSYYITSCKQCPTKIRTNYENNETKAFQLQKIRILRG